MFIAKNNDLIILAKETREELEKALQFMVYTSIEETDIEYELYNGEYLTKEEIIEKERERLSKLSLTRGDVFEALILSKQLTKVQIRGLIETADIPELDKLLYLNRFDEALNFYRGYPIFDLLGEVIGITPEMWDIFFETNDWHELTSKEVEK